ncbi:MAG: IS21 family transposase, partial [Burkholderiales bacterium]|nr:IS21 family transposase [Burkholderiales bacterium]
RMESACARALAVGAHRYRSVNSILEKGLDRQPPLTPQAELALPDHANVRGPDYYH